VPLRTALKNFQDFQAGPSSFRAVVFEFVDLSHGVLGSAGKRFSIWSCRYNALIISATPQP
jgi:hypothetical protein